MDEVTSFWKRSSLRLQGEEESHPQKRIFVELTFSRMYLPSLYFCDESGDTNCSGA